MKDEQFSQRSLAVAIVEKTTPEEQLALKSWTLNLLDIRSENISALEKAKKAFVATKNHKILWPIIKMMAREIKRYGWDERSKSSRFGIGVAGAALLFFGNQGAGIAALGTAIGVPLWFVLGAGATFAGHLVEELTKSLNRSTKANPSDIIIEVKKKE